MEWKTFQSLELVEKAADDMDVDTGMGAGASNKPVTPSSASHSEVIRFGSGGA